VVLYRQEGTFVVPCQFEGADEFTEDGVGARELGGKWATSIEWESSDQTAVDGRQTF